MRDQDEFDRDEDGGQPADSDEVLHHITVADVETLHGMVLTEDQAEQIKDRLAQALTNAINEIRGIDPEEITSEDEMAFERQIERDGR